MPRLLEIEGGRRLRGEVAISGSKNAALPIMAASLLTTEACRVGNLPRLADVDNAAGILADLGVTVGRESAGEVSLVAEGEIGDEVSLDRGRRMRASILFMGPLLARTGRALVPKPGGDDIGMRRLDQHVYGLMKLGAHVEEREGSLVCTADRLRGAEIFLDMPTVTGTENLMMAACTAAGRTRIYNAAREPHVQDLARALNKMGAAVAGAGTDEVVIDGVDQLGGFDHDVVSDYLEAGTYALAVAATGGEVRLTSAPPEDLHPLVLKLRASGVEVDVGDGTMTVGRDGPLKPVDLITWTHPGFPTDLQPQFTALMLQADGQSVVQEFLYENRFHYVGQLVALGASIEVLAHSRSIRIYGPCRLRGGEVSIPDIRAGAALLIAALCAEGVSQVSGADHLDRGYESLAGKLSNLGARIREVAAGNPAGET